MSDIHQSSAGTVLVGTLVREEARERPQHDSVRRPAHVARMLALAHHIQRAIDRNSSADRASVSRQLGFTRARITQLLDLLLLASDLQVTVSELEAVDGVEPLSERRLRHIAQKRSWAEQRQFWRELQQN